MTLDVGKPFDRATFALADRYRAAGGVAVVSGVQAIVRLLIEVHARDAARGRRTGVFVSGYQGSPLGGLDTAMLGQRATLKASDVHVQPALNEELAATAVWGSQFPIGADRGGRFPGYDGVVGVWYGKSPGVDRACDAFRHGNTLGVNPQGGVLVLAGDDPAGKSSTLPCASEPVFASLMMPLLSPRDAHELLRFGLIGVELSRFSGCWVGMKITTDVADGLWTLPPFDGRNVAVQRPELSFDGVPWSYTQYPVAAPPHSSYGERDLYGPRWRAAEAFIAANEINAIEGAKDDAWIGIVASGKTYGDVREVLCALQLDDADLARRGIRLLRLGSPFPVSADIVQRFAHGLDEIVVVEEKRAFIEPQVRDRLYASASRPAVVGKHDETGRTLVPSDGELTAARLLPVLRARLGRRLDLPEAAHAEFETPLDVARSPYFCSGCPHNRSTVLPEGSIGGGGIGCHSIAALMPRESSKVTGITQMGGEGSQWIGQAPFSDVPHIFQNIGDGTLFHSGQLAIQACVAAGVNITFKILYNGAVAMTGGQDAVGALPVPALARKLVTEGAGRIIVCADDVSRYASDDPLPDGTLLWDRDRLDEAQRMLREVPGVTVLIYDQRCATEARRLRKRGKLADPTMRIAINERVCEGCGDCGVKSNCLSVFPVDTEFGRKRRIDQASCNKDYTCIEGDCPSFVSVTAAPSGVKAPRAPAPIVPEPARPQVPEDRSYDVFLVGVGGTGVVTVNAVLATAAMADGLVAGGVDQTGLSQKAGTVSSHLRIARSGELVAVNRVRPDAVPCYIAFDLLAGSDAKALAAADPNVTNAAVSTAEVPTGPMVADKNVAFPEATELAARIARHARSLVTVDAANAAAELAGDALGANFLLIGAAYQAGFLPLSAESIEWAIGLNGVAVEMNVQAFRWGRVSVAQPAAFAGALGSRDAAATTAPAADVTPLFERELLDGEPKRLAQLRAADLLIYSGLPLAHRYVALVERAWRADRAAGPDDAALSAAVATQFYRLLAYKDEYEVARLLTEPAFRSTLGNEIPNGTKLRYHLHPPLLRSLGMKKKLALGEWFTPVLHILRRARGLRGTPFDPFGSALVRRVERALIEDYETAVGAAIDAVLHGTGDRAAAIALANAPETIRGYEEIKLRNVRQYLAELAERGASAPRTAALLASPGHMQR